MDSSKLKLNKVSIIVAVYNVERYIGDCIRSIIVQSYKNLEIILIDDGSTDDSGQICEQFTSIDNRVIVIHKKNGGVSSARNHGLNCATGDYVTFIDGDDFVAPDYIDYMIQVSSLTGADYVIVSKCFTSHSLKQIHEDNIRIWSSEMALLELLYPRITVGCWNKMYSRDLLTKYGIYFQTDLFIGEGLRFIIDVAQRANCIGVGDRKVYHYRTDNPDSCMTKKDVRKAICALEAIESVKENLLISSLEVKRALDFHIWLTNFLFVRFVVSTHEKRLYMPLYKKCKKHLRKGILVIIMSRTSFAVKLVSLMILVTPALVAVTFNKLKQIHLI
jgi:glycosyltransferase involved in cell wall biosynthesis